jgi:ATP-dependent helicase Lhr and Lhr-like helicase
VDEAHAFAASDRGAHLAAVLERLSAFCSADVQRIGLSATVGNPEAVLAWMQGSSKREAVVVSPPRPVRAAEVTVDFVGSSQNAAAVIEQLHRGEKRLVFIDSRRGVEELGAELRARGVDTYLVHGSLAHGEREASERAFADGKNRVIVATSALELGIDVGDLDRVLQLDAPTTVASFLQRMGRTGRREGTTPNCTFLVTEEKHLLQTVALTDLYFSGYVEPIAPSDRAFHVLAHQVLGMAMADRGLERVGWFSRVRRASCFSGITDAEANALVDHMLGANILGEVDSRLLLGPEGERLYGRRNYSELYAVFSTPRVMRVEWARQEIGSVTTDFLSALDSKTGPPSFSLGGRAWQVDHIDWDKGLCVVSPCDNARAPSWGGKPQLLSYEMCQAMRRILLASDEPVHWSQRVRKRMAGLRAQNAFLADLQDGIVDGANEIVWWNFAGGRANLLLARMVESELGSKCVSRNVSITLKQGAALSGVAFRQFLDNLRAEGRPNESDVQQAAAGIIGRVRVSKFEPCVPSPLLLAVVESSGLRVSDAHAALRPRP